MSYNDNSILDVKELTVVYNSYGSRIKALDNYSLASIRPGSWTFITGHNGSGKSTLFKVIAKRISDYSGVIRLGGMDIRNISPKKISSFVFLVTQNPASSTVDELTVLENLRFASTTSSENIDYLKQLLEESGLFEHRHHLVKNLSGGQRQLLALQIAKLRRVKILLLDEAFAALDISNTRKAVQLLKNIHSNGTTILFITHDSKLLNDETMKSISDVININPDKSIQ